MRCRFVCFEITGAFSIYSVYYRELFVFKPYYYYIATHDWSGLHLFIKWRTLDFFQTTNTTNKTIDVHQYEYLIAQCGAFWLGVLSFYSTYLIWWSFFFDFMTQICYICINTKIQILHVGFQLGFSNMHAYV